jgi:hypothetical protein
MTAITPQSGVPSPITLLAIQAAGGLLALLPIISLNKFATLPKSLYNILTAAAIANLVISTMLLIGFIAGWQYILIVISQIGESGFTRALLFYDMIMLGGLVCLTGGSDKSAFAPQFAAILPMAMLIPDVAAIKWAYAAVFLFMFLLGLQNIGPFQDYLPDNRIRERWIIVFFFIFTLFPVIYSIQTERAMP